MKVYSAQYHFNSAKIFRYGEDVQLPQDQLRLVRGEYTLANNRVMIQETPQSYQLQNARHIQANTDDI